MTQGLITQQRMKALKDNRPIPKPKISKVKIPFKSMDASQKSHIQNYEKEKLIK